MIKPSELSKISNKEGVRPQQIEKDYMQAKKDLGCPTCGANPLKRATHYAVKSVDHPNLKLDINSEDSHTIDVFSGSAMTLSTTKVYT
jgi:hypothetical protein